MLLEGFPRHDLATQGDFMFQICHYPAASFLVDISQPAKGYSGVCSHLHIFHYDVKALFRPGRRCLREFKLVNTPVDEGPRSYAPAATVDTDMRVDKRFE